MISFKDQRKKHYREFKIYKITNPANQVYIGVSSNLEKRLNVYKNQPDTYKNQTYLHQSMLKYGYDNHKVEVLKTVEIGDNINELYKVNIIEQREIIKHYKELGENQVLNAIIKGINHKERYVKV